MRKQKKILSQELLLPIPKPKTSHHRDGSATLSMNCSEQEMAVLEKARELLSHALPSLDWKDLFVHLAEKTIKSKTKLRNVVKDGKEKRTLDKSLQGENRPRMESPKADSPKDKDPLPWQATADTAVRAQTSKANKDIPVSLRKLIYQRDQCCQYRDPITNRQCGGKLFLEIDHKQSKWADGDNSIENLHLLCSNHNKNKYRKESRPFDY